MKNERGQGVKEEGELEGLDSESLVLWSYLEVAFDTVIADPLRCNFPAASGLVNVNCLWLLAGFLQAAWCY